MTTQSVQAKIAASYDNVPYPAYTFAQTHPDRLATIGTLLGLHVAPVANCRVLELGCSDGGNLLPMACQLPDSQFIGVDLSGAAIERGNIIASELGVKNIVLQRKDLLEINQDFGEFDYIIAHGLYSWIPPSVREKLFAICRTNLAPNGIAYISYNACPGYQLWRMTREMMQFHTRAMTEPEEIISQSISLLRFLSMNSYQHNESRRELYQAVVSEHLRQIERYRHTQQLFHDELSEFNEPVYFHEFVRQAAQHKLQFLAEADFFEMFDFGFPADAQKMLAQFGDENILLREQYLDFLKGRTFRQSLLCHSENTITRKIDAEKMNEFYLATLLDVCDEQPDLRPNVVQKFKGAKGSILQTDFPLAKAALIQLRKAWPRYVSFSELVQLAKETLQMDATQHGYTIEEFTENHLEVLREIILAAYKTGIIQLHSFRPTVSLELGTHPKVFSLARVQAQYQNTVTNLIHKTVEIELPFLRQLLTLMDGSRDVNVLKADMVAWLKKAENQSALVKEIPKDQDSLAALVAETFAEVLPQLKNLVLLEADA